jgi:hypothetical protein
MGETKANKDAPSNVDEIVDAWLREHGFDGLFYPGECACFVGDIAPCGQIGGECEPGYAGTCDESCTHECAEPGAKHISRKRDSDHT